MFYLVQVAAELGARPSVDLGTPLTPEEQADADQDVTAEGPHADDVAPSLHAITSRQWSAPAHRKDDFDIKAARDGAYSSWQQGPPDAGIEPSAGLGTAVRDLQPV